MNRFKQYYQLAKPGIIYGNLLTTIASFLYASDWKINLVRLAATVFGTGLTIGAACVSNNVLDQRIDRTMERTRSRSLARGEIKVSAAVVYAAVLGVVGFSLLALFVNWLTVGVGLVGVLFYVVVYGLAKRRTKHGTLIGGVSGATPILAGYTAVTGRLDFTALLLFLILFFWQMPHFYAIGIYRRQDYAAAGLPIWPVKVSIASAIRWMVVYTVLFCLAVVLFSVVGKTGGIFLLLMLLGSAYWLWLGIKGLRPEVLSSDGIKWARGMFGYSLLTLMLLSALLAVEPVLPRML